MPASRETGGVQLSALTRLWDAASVMRRLPPPTPAVSILPFWGLYDLRLLDIRTETDFLRRHIPEACSIPHDDLDARTYELPPKWRRLIVADSRPVAAREITGRLRAKGWRGAVALQDPVESWPGPWESGPARRTLWEPAPVVVDWGARLPVGRLLDLGCGSGRDAVYLAQLGHEVTVVDRLGDALEKAEALAARADVSLELHEMDLRHERPEAAEGFDAILMLRFFERSLLPWIASALRPGGILVLETFADDAEGPGPRRPRWKLGRGEALKALGQNVAFEVLESLERTDPSGVTVARLVVRKAPFETGHDGSE